jgi:hypothetical protein
VPVCDVTGVPQKLFDTVAPSERWQLAVRVWVTLPQPDGVDQEPYWKL